MKTLRFSDGDRVRSAKSDPYLIPKVRPTALMAFSELSSLSLTVGQEGPLLGTSGPAKSHPRTDQDSTCVHADRSLRLNLSVCTFRKNRRRVRSIWEHDVVESLRFWEHK
eukprot:6199867-Pleurochrysis_carterae.AAC.5